jgi:hypothetical protein
VLLNGVNILQILFLPAAIASWPTKSLSLLTGIQAGTVGPLDMSTGVANFISYNDNHFFRIIFILSSKLRLHYRHASGIMAYCNVVVDVPATIFRMHYDFRDFEYFSLAFSCRNFVFFV